MSAQTVPIAVTRSTRSQGSRLAEGSEMVESCYDVHDLDDWYCPPRMALSGSSAHGLKANNELTYTQRCRMHRWRGLFGRMDDQSVLEAAR